VAWVPPTLASPRPQQPDATPVRPALDARVWTLLIVAGVVVVGLLVGMLLVLNSTRAHLVEQDQRTRLLIQKADPTFQRAPDALDAAKPLLRDAAPVLKASRAAIPASRKAARDAQELLDASKPVVDDLASVTGALPPLLRDLTPAAADLRPVAAELRAADLPQLVRSLDALATTGQQALPPLAGLAKEVRDRALLRRLSRALPDLGRIAALQRAALQTNRQTLTRTAHIEDMFSQSLEIQRQTLAHTENIDRKLGGSALTR
jgi:hypothetical protein